ncbi:uncharacterized protein PAN0_001c0036 [Moesziomyces antarcticus]|uniref:Uncharacterized protein n=1 Tax=Pseudozyma antarctica TaxID=84753 RepID=A0A5C3FG60_PSEA2|nr:uncharacterized protein PAN0_001c0036 [Moesziomyces antarcticus]GAK61841.1 hypothetical protein PAN0_001c0036 [Moesziomyces antarcticus]SPO42359.1 uncharacterized protein PSANT_00042 [Moesziomyces antarcticus]
MSPKPGRADGAVESKNGAKPKSTDRIAALCGTDRNDTKEALTKTAQVDALDDCSDGDEWTQLTQPLTADEQIALLRAEMQQLRKEVNALARNQTKTDSALAKLEKSTEKLKDKIKAKKS